MSYILILTLIVSSGTGGSGGITNIEFDTKEKCEEVGKLWMNQIKGIHRSFYLCVEAPKVE